MIRVFCFCDWCEQALGEGDTYNEIWVVRRVVGENPPIYAAKLYACLECDEKDKIWVVSSDGESGQVHASDPDNG